MNPLKKTARFGAAALITAALVAASVVPAQAAPRDNKNELLSASATLASQAKTALSVTGGSNDSCKPWNTNAAYSNAALTSINFARGLAGVPNLTSNEALNNYARQYVNYKCTATRPAQAMGYLGYSLQPGDPGSVRYSLNDSSSTRLNVLSTTAKYYAVGNAASTYNGVAREQSFVSSSSTSDYLSYRNKAIAWPSASYFPVELSNGIWSYYAKNNDYKTDPQLDAVKITVTNSAGKALAVEKITSGGWNSSYDRLHFKVPAATVGNTKGNEASYTVTITGAYTGYGSSKVNLAPIKYTVKLVRTGASFKYTAVAPKITKQPAKSVSVKVNKYIKLSASAFIPGQQDVSYQWQYKRPGSSKWETIYGATTPTVSVTPNGLSLNKSVARLKVTSSGKTAYTNNVTLKVTKYASTVKITKASLKRGKKPAVTVKASQAGKVKVTATKGKTKITKTVKVKKNKATKVTLSKAITKKAAGKGKWKVTVKFTPTKSSLYAGKTATKTVKVK